MLGKKLPDVSGFAVLKAFCNKMGFAEKSRRGSHVLICGSLNGKKVCFPVPLHDRLSKYTLVAIIRESGLTRAEFLELFK